MIGPLRSALPSSTVRHLLPPVFEAIMGCLG
jgi:hypothetical protein